MSRGSQRAPGLHERALGRWRRASKGQRLGAVGGLVLLLGLSVLEVTFKGAILVPSPDILLAGIPTDGAGDLLISATWPAGLPAGVPIAMQEWIVDATGPVGFSVSNGLVAVTP